MLSAGAHALAAPLGGKVQRAGLNELRLGRFRVGWENYELRWFARAFAHTERKYPLPRWNGEALDGPLLISGEQGLGDQVLYASMLPDALSRTPEITIEVAPRLIPLFARSFPQVNVVAREEGQLYRGPAVAQIPIASLGRALPPRPGVFPFATRTDTCAATRKCPLACERD